MINKAIQFATVAHSNQFRKDSKIPYILHCLEAGTIAASLATKDGIVDQELVASAILHDTIEDANVTKEAIENLFGERVAHLVSIQSEDKSKKWLERKQDTIDFLNENLTRDAEVATLADKLSNMRAIYKDYCEQGDELWKKFNADKSSQHWYYSSIGESMKYVCGTKEHDEYMDLVNKVFN